MLLQRPVLESHCDCQSRAVTVQVGIRNLDGILAGVG